MNFFDNTQSILSFTFVLWFFKDLLNYRDKVDMSRYRVFCASNVHAIFFNCHYLKSCLTLMMSRLDFGLPILLERGQIEPRRLLNQLIKKITQLANIVLDHAWPD